MRPRLFAILFLVLAVSRVTSSDSDVPVAPAAPDASKVAVAPSASDPARGSTPAIGKPAAVAEKPASGTAAAPAVKRAGGTASSKTPDAPANWERYKVLAQRNIFLRPGMPRGLSSDQKNKDSTKGANETGKGTGSESGSVAAALSPEAATVLNGIVSKDGKLTAFLENRKTSTSLMVSTGDTLLTGKVTQITLDSIEFTCNGKPIIISVGKALDGSVAEVSKSAAPDSHADGASGGENAILERMRKKRQEEMQK